MFSTIAIIFWHWIVILIVTLWTFPIEDNIILFFIIFIYIKNPIFDTFKVHRNWTASTSPYIIFPSHIFRTYDTKLFKMTLSAVLSFFVIRDLIFFFFVIRFMIRFILLCFLVMSFYFNFRIILHILFFLNIFRFIFLFLCNLT